MTEFQRQLLEALERIAKALEYQNTPPPDPSLKTKPGEWITSSTYPYPIDDKK